MNYLLMEYCRALIGLILEDGFDELRNSLETTRKNEHINILLTCMLQYYDVHIFNGCDNIVA